MRQHGMSLEDGDFVLLLRLFQTSANIESSLEDGDFVLLLRLFQTSASMDRSGDDGFVCCCRH